MALILKFLKFTSLIDTHGKTIINKIDVYAPENC